MICELCQNKKNVFYIESLGKFDNYFMCEECIVNKKYRKDNFNKKNKMNYFYKFIYSFYYLNYYKYKFKNNFHSLYLLEKDDCIYF